MLMMIVPTSVIGDAWSNTTHQFIWLCRVVTGHQNTSMLYVTTRLNVMVSHTTLLLVSVLSLSGTSTSCPVNFHSVYLLVLRLFLDIFVLVMYTHCFLVWAEIAGLFHPSACQLSAVVPFRLLVLRYGTA